MGFNPAKIDVFEKYKIFSNNSFFNANIFGVSEPGFIRVLDLINRSSRMGFDQVCVVIRIDSV